MSTLRLPFAASSGVLVTLAVFSLLWHFVSVPIDIGKPIETVKVDWKRVRTSTPIEPKRPQKVDRDPPPIVPETPKVRGEHVIAPPTPYARPERVGPTIGPGRGLAIGIDSEPIPVVRAAPDYPPRALANGVEGWVQVRFTVTAVGTVIDAVVVDAAPKNTFDDAALKALARWRYNPKVEGGVGVERVGLQTVIRFQLE